MHKIAIFLLCMYIFHISGMDNQQKIQQQRSVKKPYSLVMQASWPWEIDELSDSDDSNVDTGHRRRTKTLENILSAEKILLKNARDLWHEKGITHANLCNRK